MKSEQCHWTISKIPSKHEFKLSKIPVDAEDFSYSLFITSHKDDGSSRTEPLSLTHEEVLLLARYFGVDLLADLEGKKIGDGAHAYLVMGSLLHNLRN